MLKHCSLLLIFACVCIRGFVDFMYVWSLGHSQTVGWSVRLNLIISLGISFHCSFALLFKAGARLGLLKILLLVLLLLTMWMEDLRKQHHQETFQ